MPFIIAGDQAVEAVCPAQIGGRQRRAANAEDPFEGLGDALQARRPHLDVSAPGRGSAKLDNLGADGALQGSQALPDLSQRGIGLHGLGRGRGWVGGLRQGRSGGKFFRHWFYSFLGARWYTILEQTGWVEGWLVNEIGRIQRGDARRGQRAVGAWLKIEIYHHRKAKGRRVFGGQGKDIGTQVAGR